MSDETATTTNSTAGTTAAAATTTQANWVDSLPENLKVVALNKGWKDPSGPVQSYDEMFRFLGAEKAGRGVVIPGDKASPEEISAFRLKLGVPSDVSGYDLKLPEGFPDPEFGKVAAPLFLKHGVTKAAGEGLIADFTAQVAAADKQRVDAEQAAFVKAETALKTEWGADFDKNVEIARRGMAKFGFTADVIDAIEAKAGFTGVLKAMHTAGVAIGEGKFVDSGGSGGGFADTHESLMAKRAALYRDPAWAARFGANEPAARDEQRALEKQIADARARLHKT